MTTYAENQATMASLVSDVEAIEAQAQADIDAKQADIAVLAATILAQEETCGHENWTKVPGEWTITCDACGKIVEISSPVMLWPWAG